MPNTHAKLIADYLAGPEALRRSIEGMNTEQLQARPVHGKWSTMEVVGHVVDSDQVWAHRMKRVIAEPKPLLIGYDESRFTATMDYHSHDLEEELTLLELTRKQLAAILRKLPEAAWSREGVHNERGLVTLKEMVELDTEHVYHHIRTIEEKRRAMGIPTS